MSNVITTENQNVGSTGWKFVSGKVATTQIQAYANKTSLDPGQTISFYVSTFSAGTAYTLNIYRLGWYDGNGGCLKYTAANTGIAQGYWDPIGLALHNVSTLIYDSTTHLTEAGWSVTDTWTVPNNAVTGIYVAMFTESSGNFQYACTFVVRSTATTPGDYLIQRSYFTDTAYNQWGGYSLYTAPQGLKVSMNRPDTYNGGGHGVYGGEIPIIKWLEHQGYSMDYLSDVDIHANAARLLSYKAVCITGHAEYWSLEMRNGFESARDKGVSLAFLSANDCYWQVRIEADASSTTNRTVTCYKVTTSPNTLSSDPFYGTDNTRITTRWRDAALNRPENSLIGIMFSSYTNTSNFAWAADASMDTTYTAGTGLVAGSSYGSDCVGNEWDNIQSGSPAGLKTIGTTSVTDLNSIADISNTTFYRAASGALVFATGSIDWVWCLDRYRWTGTQPVEVPAMQTLLANIMGALKGPVYKGFIS